MSAHPQSPIVWCCPFCQRSFDVGRCPEHKPLPLGDVDAIVERMAVALHDHDLAPGEPPCDTCRSRARAMLEAAYGATA